MIKISTGATHVAGYKIKIQAIYKIRNLINEYSYIGSSSNVMQRRNKHFHQLKHNIHDNKALQKDFNEFGFKNFVFEILELVDNEKLLEREQCYLDNCNLKYNRAPNAGSNKGIKLSEEHKQKISFRFKGEKHPRYGKKATPEESLKMSLIRKGKRPSEETRKKLSESQKGRKQSKETKEKLSLRFTGEKSTNVKLKEFQVIEIKELLLEGMSQRKIAEIYGVCQRTIGSINTGRIWRHIL